MLQKLRGNSEGFTLIELMIVIAIIGILAAIAIPNFIAYRNKAFCSRAESDGASAVNTLADYYSIPTHVDLETDTSGTALNIEVSPENSVDITGNVNQIVVRVTDGSGRCPTEYRRAMTPQWDDAQEPGVFTLDM